MVIETGVASINERDEKNSTPLHKGLLIILGLGLRERHFTGICLDVNISVCFSVSFSKVKHKII